MHQFAVVPFLRVSCAPLGVAPILADIRADANGVFARRAVAREAELS